MIKRVKDVNPSEVASGYVQGDGLQVPTPNRRSDDEVGLVDDAESRNGSGHQRITIIRPQ